MGSPESTEGDNGCMEARHQGQASEIDGVVLLEISKRNPVAGEMTMVEVTDVEVYNLVGR